MFSTSTAYELPDLPAYTGPIPDHLIGYREKRLDGPAPAGAAVHFYLSDYRFESVWFRVEQAWQYIRRFQIALVPDFSLTEAAPFVVNLAQIYRARWVARLWNTRGLSVIPSLTWAGPASYDYCFTGIGRGSIVAVGTVGVKDWSVFEAGFSAAVYTIAPRLILIYGPQPPESVVNGLDFVRYPSRWGALRCKDKGAAGHAINAGAAKHQN